MANFFLLIAICGYLQSASATFSPEEFRTEVAMKMNRGQPQEIFIPTIDKKSFAETAAGSQVSALHPATHPPTGFVNYEHHDFVNGNRHCGAQTTLALFFATGMCYWGNDFTPSMAWNILSAEVDPTGQVVITTTIYSDSACTSATGTPFVTTYPSGCKAGKSWSFSTTAPTGAMVNAGVVVSSFSHIGDVGTANWYQTWWMPTGYCFGDWMQQCGVADGFDSIFEYSSSESYAELDCKGTPAVDYCAISTQKPPHGPLVYRAFNNINLDGSLYFASQSCTGSPQPAPVSCVDQYSAPTPAAADNGGALVTYTFPNEASGRPSNCHHDSVSSFSAFQTGVCARLNNAFWYQFTYLGTLSNGAAFVEVQYFSFAKCEGPVVTEYSQVMQYDTTLCDMGSMTAYEPSMPSVCPGFYQTYFSTSAHCEENRNNAGLISSFCMPADKCFPCGSGCSESLVCEETGMSTYQIFTTDNCMGNSSGNGLPPNGSCVRSHLGYSPTTTRCSSPPLMTRHLRSE